MCFPTWNTKFDVVLLSRLVWTSTCVCFTVSYLNCLDEMYSIQHSYKFSYCYHYKIYVKYSIVRAQRFVFSKGRARSFKIMKAQDCFCHNNCKGSGKVCFLDIKRPGINLLQTPSVPSSVFLVWIRDALCLLAGGVNSSVIKYDRQG